MKLWHRSDEAWLAAEWRQAWRWLQVQLGAVIALAPEVYNALDQVQDAVPPSLFRHAMAVLGVLVIINSLRRKSA